ncbi:cardioacceleratory peptide receptor isoform X3 [Procambarus clarkii]|uniref:cardioacceleratory peptide receptor isoform X3 n=1 Tax=Procambarus clarkii TaxID=6728 RepID=UPI001E670DE7|nr:cardioacceleratory peptide receptor-like isoform X2 [Procambarus clarkii]
MLFISIVVGNVAVIAALMLSKTRKSRTNFFIMHLALADLSVGLISVLTDIVWKSTVSWNAGNVGCKAVRFAQVLVTYSSTYVLVALSIDRYDAITHPMNFSGSWRRARRLVLVAWLLSAVFASPSLVFFMEARVDGAIQCWIDFPEAWQWKLYMTLVALSVFLFPTVIITACYAIIVYTIWSKSKIMTVNSKALGSKNGEKRGGHHEDDSRRASSRGLIPKAKIKTVKMTLVIVFVFILCWSPYIVFDLLQVYGYVPQSPTNVAVATFIQSLAPLNSAANPIIYCLFSTHICRNLRYHPIRAGAELNQGSSLATTTTLPREYLNTELLTYNTKRSHDTLIRGSVV